MFGMRVNRKAEWEGTLGQMVERLQFLPEEFRLQLHSTGLEDPGKVTRRRGT